MSLNAEEFARRELRIVTGDPSQVEVQAHLLADRYAVSNVFYYVVKDELRVALTLLSKDAIAAAQRQAAITPPFFKMRPN